MLFTVISGTNRPGSNTRKVAGFIEKLFIERLPAGDKVQVLDLAKLPLDVFQPQSYGEKPASLEAFKDAFMSSDALFTVLPEYNGSAPGVFKYFIDLMPFPGALLRKPSAFVGIGAGRFGGLRSVEHMQQVWDYRQAYVYSERVFIPFVDKAIDSDGKPLDAKVAELVQSEVTGFIGFAKKLVPAN